MWLASAEVLKRIFANASLGRSGLRIEDLLEKAHLFVPHGRLEAAQSTLSKHKSLIISGPPGVGKTTMAEMLVLPFLERGVEVVFATSISEIEASAASPEPQLFVYDDFLGRTSLTEAPSESEQERIMAMIDRFRRRTGKHFILTTREYLYQEALVAGEAFRPDKADVLKFIVTVSGYDRLARAKILYNHLYFNLQIDRDDLAEFVNLKHYESVLKHKQFNPRWIADTINRLYPVESAATLE